MFFNRWPKLYEEEWCAPEIVEEPILEIEEGFHPVVGSGAARSDFTPNDVSSGAGATLSVITGPNMAGKSTYIRQTALICILGQMGAFVPAKKAVLGLADRIFTRVGAADDLVHGQSTFMVEMVGNGPDLHNATERSLVILDEVDEDEHHDGVSIAWAIAEDLPNGSVAELFSFATHYHELVALEELLPEQVTNLCVEVKEWKDEIVFLHKIRPGSADNPMAFMWLARQEFLTGVGASPFHSFRSGIARLDSPKRWDRTEVSQMNLFTCRTAGSL